MPVFSQSICTTHSSVVQLNYELYCIVFCCIVLYRILLYCIVLYSILLYCIVLYCIVSYCIVLYCIVLYCIVLYCIDLYYIVLYCIVLNCAISSYFVHLYSISQPFFLHFLCFLPHLSFHFLSNRSIHLSLLLYALL